MRKSIAAGALAVTTAASSVITTSPAALGASTDRSPALKVGTGLVETLHSHPITAAGKALLAREKAAAKAKAARAAAAARARHKAAAAAARAKAHARAVKAARARAVAAARAKAARDARRRALLTPSYVWAHKPFSIRVANCESGGGPRDHSSSYDGNAHLRDPNGHYGKWQFDYSTWRDVGGSGNPADAGVTEQDQRAYRLFQQRGWQPWQCARMVG